MASHDVGIADAAGIAGVRPGRAGPAPSWLAGAEAAGVYGLILSYIWWGRAHSRGWILLPLIAVTLSHLWRGETPAALGFRSTNFGRCCREIGPWLLGLALGGAALSVACGTADATTLRRLLPVVATYAPWGLFQQYALNGYFANRFARAVGNPRLAALLAAACFAGAHVPNWFLLGVTLVAGYASARAYLRHRNLLFLGLAHAVIGALLVLAVPRSITQGLRTGPGAWRAMRATSAPPAPVVPLARLRDGSHPLP